MFQVHNQCGAPQSFVDTIYATYPKIQDFAKNEFGIDRSFLFSDVVIIEKDNEPQNINERYSMRNLEKLFHSLFGEIEKLQSLVREMPNWERLVKDLMKESYEVYHSEMSDCNTETKGRGKIFSKKERIQEINILINELRKIKNIAKANDCYEIADTIDKIVDLWKETSHILIYVEYPIVRFGFYTPKREDICLCYQSICDDIGTKLTDEYGAFVFAHECFHALHYGHVRENPGIRKWDSTSIPAHIRRRAVKESLAEYFSLEYADRMLTNSVYSQAWKAALAHPFPNWGYAGAKLFSLEPMYNGTGKSNSLFNAVYYASIMDMEIAYRLLDSTQSKSSDYDDHYSISTGRFFLKESTRHRPLIIK